MSATAAPPAVLRPSDIVVTLGILAIVLMMVMPLPPFALDMLLAVSIAISTAVFITALVVEDALQFSAFPSIVLVATLLRLSLNVATTRLILLHGHQGAGAAGNIVEAFGRFVVGGNVVVGLVVFLILVVINFIVITKGAGRIAEVAARFTLDAMPGKQMAVDADLSAGVIDNEQARTRRQDLGREADFYGAMDGASKFVQGDAIAGLLITAINLIGGLILGVASGMDIATAAHTFSVLTVGDALVSQLPALLVSSAAGVVVTRSASGEPLGRVLVAQLTGRRRVVTMTAGIVTLLGLMPGMPVLPCFGVAAGLLLLGRRKGTAAGKPSGGAAASATDASSGQSGAAPDVDALLAVDVLTLELGSELLSLVDRASNGTLLDRVGAIRREIAKELGIVVPPVHVCDNLALVPGRYRLLLLDTEIGSGLCRAGRRLAIDSGGGAPPLEGEVTTEPAFGMAARWIHARDQEMGEALGYTVVDHATQIATHLAELVRRSAHRLLGRQELQHLLDVLAKRYPKLVDDVVPNLLPLGAVLRVLRNLLRERVSIRDLRTIMESLAELSSQTTDPEQLTELVRERLSVQITSSLRGPDGTVAALALDPRLEQALRDSLRDIASGVGGVLDAAQLKRIGEAAEQALAKFAAMHTPPALVTPPDLRRYVRTIFEHKLPSYTVLSFREIEPDATLRIVESIGGGRPSAQVPPDAAVREGA